MKLQKLLTKLFQVTNVHLTDVQEQVNALSLNKNVLILSSCGSGKSEVAYHILREWKRKSIYVLPQKTLATSLYHRFKKYNDMLGEKESWTINHSSLQEDKFLSNFNVVTTIDQVLGGYLGIGVQSYIKGKNIVQSNFVFDEIQLFEPGKSLKTTIQMLDSLFRKGNRFVIMTATMPQYLIDFLSQRYDMDRVITEKPSIKDRKTILRYQEKFNVKSVNEYQRKQIIICNTIKEMVQVYDQLQDKSRAILLNGKLLSNDREKIERDVEKYFGKNAPENNKILISNQVLEAGIDISATRLYSSVCSIDSLIQREGRLCRWGGEGELIIFNGDWGFYDQEIVFKTLNTIKNHQDVSFTWDIQKKWVNDILNPYYEKYISERELKKQRIKLKTGNRNELIREIANVSIIVDPNPSIKSLQKDSISIHIEQVKKLGVTNTLYGIKHNYITEIPVYDVSVGDTVIIKGDNCIYDEVGFRLKEGAKCKEFPDLNKENINREFNNYKEEPWILHAKEVRNIMKEKLTTDKFSDYVRTNYDWIAEIAGLHDLGKLDIVWQGQHWANSTEVPLAHFPFHKGNGRIFKERNHAVISAQILKPHIDYLLFNMILQHHKRYIHDGTCIHLHEYELDNRSEQCLKEYGFTESIQKKDKNKDISYQTDIINPAHPDWVEFVYLVGTLMESDIEAINKVQAIL